MTIHKNLVAFDGYEDYACEHGGCAAGEEAGHGGGEAHLRLRGAAAYGVGGDPSRREYAYACEDRDQEYGS
jgi:hypothetical protein